MIRALKSLERLADEQAMDKPLDGLGANYTVKIDGRSIPFPVRDCKVCLGGEFSGNVDLVVGCEIGDMNLLGEHLKIRVSGESALVEALAWGPAKGNVGFTFGVDSLEGRRVAPDTITLYCGDTEVADLPCRLAGSKAFDASCLIDPLQILKGIPPVPSQIVIGGRRNLYFGAFGSLALAIGLALAAGFVEAKGAETIPRIAGAGLSIFGLMCLGAVLVRDRQIRIDPMKGTVTTVHARFPSLVSEGEVEFTRNVSEFSHVRIDEFVRNDVNDDSDPVFVVSYEGLVPFTDDAGISSPRGDSIRLKELGSDLSARRFAAQVAYPFGLQILDTTDTD